MKTKTKKEKTQKVETWLPVFSGFYGTMWDGEGDEERELEYINELREDKNLPPVEWDAVEFDYSGYHKAVVEGVTSYVEAELIKLGMIQSCKLQRIVSPREYNFKNDSGDVEIKLTDKNIQTIENYLKTNAEQFSKYLERYKSYDGFISFHSHRIENWLAEFQDAVLDAHKLGSMLEFILKNEDGGDFEGNGLEWFIYEDLSGNGVTLQAKNYDKLMKA